MTSPPVRAEVRYTGRVQGVGFRWRAVTAAAPFAVTGHVRNLRDGSVEIVAEGSRSDVDAFLAAVADRTSRCVAEASVRWTAPRGARATFDIVR